MTAKFEYQPQVEQDLGRALTEAELQEVPSLADLTDEQVAVAAAIRRNHYITPMVYVRAIVPTAAYADVRRFLDEDIERIAAERRPPEALPNLQLFELHAGRPLQPLEQVRVESFDKLSSEQIGLARTLARKELSIGFLYLSRVVPGESTERRHELAKHLAGLA